MRAPYTTHALWFPDPSIQYGYFSYSVNSRDSVHFQVPTGPAFNIYQAQQRVWPGYKKSFVTKDPHDFSRIIQQCYSDEESLNAYVDMISQLINSIKWTHPAGSWIKNLTAILYLGYIPSAFNLSRVSSTIFSEYVSKLCHVDDASLFNIFDTLSRMDESGVPHKHLTSGARRNYISTLIPSDQTIDEH